MKVVIDRNACAHHPSVCEECFSEFLRRRTVPRLPCALQVSDDRQPEIRVTIKSGDQEGTLIVTPQNRDAIIYNGWMRYVQMKGSAPRGS